jgi:hypothetical protein
MVQTQAMGKEAFGSMTILTAVAGTPRHAEIEATKI